MVTSRKFKVTNRVFIDLDRKCGWKITEIYGITENKKEQTAVKNMEELEIRENYNYGRTINMEL